LKNNGFCCIQVNIADRLYPANRTHIWVQNWVRALNLQESGSRTQYAPKRP